ncbi:hypothetical protein [Rhodovulum adriaticum]|uniref:Uncharacterized protein n=1 Tax=Rhodovulum adriaticum TaxID=35804 RepID=A0A4R2NWE0_RHOAD|nr:hypothetical protein [Rhodovulum adriaticum]MBK1636306.1 hypothetical protein [Rhodovulum adriaticum]TCP26307.1 hypothetical protein EV656_102270 [Rhodovulum adriaticum]
MQMNLASDSAAGAEAPQADNAWVSPELHAVTPDVKLKYWSGIPPYGVWAFFAFLMLEAVMFSDHLVPYCEANFAQPQNCAPIFTQIFPILIGLILLFPVVTGAARRMGGNRITAQAFVFLAAFVPTMMLAWHYFL